MIKRSEQYIVFFRAVSQRCADGGDAPWTHGIKECGFQGLVAALEVYREVFAVVSTFGRLNYLLWEFWFSSMTIEV